MNVLSLCIRIGLCLLLLVSGLAKLADRAGTKQAIIDFGLPLHMATPLGFLVPLLELAIVVALMTNTLAQWGALGAFTLFLLFSIFISINLWKGNHPQCHCFGQLSATPIGKRDLVRNGLLISLALWLLWRRWQGLDQGGIESLLALPPFLLLAGAGLVGMVFIEGWLLLRLTINHKQLVQRVEALETHMLDTGKAADRSEPPTTIPLVPTDLPVGAFSPTFSLPDLEGNIITLETLRIHGKPIFLIFTDPGCGPCAALLPQVGRWQQDYGEAILFVLISRGTWEANVVNIAAYRFHYVVLQRDREVALLFQAHATPSAVLVYPHGRIGSRVALGATQITSLLLQTVSATRAMAARTT